MSSLDRDFWTFFKGGKFPLKVMQLGNFSSATAGAGLTLTRVKTAGFRLYGDDNGAALYGSGSVPDIRNSLSRFLITADQTGGHVRLFAHMGQLKGYNAGWNTEVASGVHGYVELVRASGTMTLGGYGITAGVTGVIATSGTMLFDTNHIVAGVAAISQMRSTGLTQTGKSAGFYVGIYDATNWSTSDVRAKWKHGLYIDAAAVLEGISVGKFASSYATGSGIVFSATATGMARFYGESTSDLTSAVSARVGVFRHLVVVAGAVNHETYGVVGQVCVKGATLGHSHAGVMGTFEVDTSAVIDYVTAGVLGRLGFTSTVTINSGKLLAGVAAMSNITTSIGTNNGKVGAFVASKYSGKVAWPNAMVVENCDKFLDITGDCVSAIAAGAPASLQLLVTVNGSPYALSVCAVGT